MRIRDTKDDRLITVDAYREKFLPGLAEAEVTGWFGEKTGTGDDLAMLQLGADECVPDKATTNTIWTAKEHKQALASLPTDFLLDDLPSRAFVTGMPAAARTRLVASWLQSRA